MVSVREINMYLTRVMLSNKNGAPSYQNTIGPSFTQVIKTVFVVCIEQEVMVKGDVVTPTGASLWARFLLLIDYNVTIKDKVNGLIFLNMKLFI
ncbi:hypothetical protein AHZ37_004579 [Salmonella enterica subsp. indica]|uniref:Uncharacterized protein n=1 Tax=Salmonella enterica subsp. indica TaxID=59207 RepID=A0A379XMW5_SALER|nr:hypothetical protein [Salmonella enterica]EBP3214573.1 hypothetical protein [Salmonella enterica subsp. arizonae]ECI8273406.1 hypothetical protein [Salmonella enterica subsp. enterica]EDR2773442.1 hypothetical protein [Salmonella enterica subsp. enterica serovar Oslo]EEC4250807.1 hypothetical protein [Salmonella enterica subsp. diarizonae]ECC3878712.1 hypothetical protein [Salmonella enterica subsp. indica]